MAAVDQFESMMEGLGEKDRRALAPRLEVWRSDLLAARSEEARVRIVHDAMAELNDRRAQVP